MLLIKRVISIFLIILSSTSLISCTNKDAEEKIKLQEQNIKSEDTQQEEQVDLNIKAEDTKLLNQTVDYQIIDGNNGLKRLVVNSTDEDFTNYTDLENVFISNSPISYELTVDKLMEEFCTDRKTFDNKYNGKIVSLKGKVLSGTYFGSSGEGELQIQAPYGDEFSSITCNMGEDAKYLKLISISENNLSIAKGTNIKVKGELTIDNSGHIKINNAFILETDMSKYKSENNYTDEPTIEITYEDLKKLYHSPDIIKTELDEKNIRVIGSLTGLYKDDGYKKVSFKSSDGIIKGIKLPAEYNVERLSNMFNLGQRYSLVCHINYNGDYQNTIDNIKDGKDVNLNAEDVFAYEIEGLYFQTNKDEL